MLFRTLASGFFRSGLLPVLHSPRRFLRARPSMVLRSCNSSGILFSSPLSSLGGGRSSARSSRLRTRSRERLPIL